MRKLTNIFLVGPMGAGKSTIGQHVAKACYLQFYDIDDEIVARTGADISWIFDIEGEAGFRRREAKVIDALTQEQGVVLATGGGVVLASENRHLLSARGVVIYLEASFEGLWQRLQNDKKRPLIQGQDRENTFRAIYEARRPLYESIADVTFDTDGQHPKAVAMQIIDKLKRIK